jgi:hypothetical protein
VTNNANKIGQLICIAILTAMAGLSAMFDIRQNVYFAALLVTWMILFSTEEKP